ncbi:hypothetical protein TRFO_24953 [Tritrichomonas foetus]|uniref:UDENN FLCN/SMCR8-type domain-containing protein n=1 Tax=Tritrichomonas foetus TaxID=1144522 RepID=A0A1J4K7D5_9EUKA|nr:hypothetical protein TRFO_24953 [Tritrichomonas foetus]|eukprot:OHT06914.1 hypothetical protein TRFO_24953 [Tritrichomonas foetus]
MESSQSKEAFVQMQSFYCAIYEFAQGSYPKTIWDNEVRLSVDPNSFRLSVVNTPTNFQPSVLHSPPTIIRSFFESVQYIAMFIQILDFEARGFTRPIVLVFACNDVNAMESLMCLRRREFLDLADKLQKLSKDKFPTELRNYALELKDAIARYGNENPGLISKFEELTKILPQAGITNLEGSRTTEKDPEFFTQINNDLRPIEDLINLNFLKEDLRKFAESLPTSNFQANVMAQSFATTAGLGIQPGLVLKMFTNDFSKETILISTMLEKKFQNLMFSILSGKTVVLITKNSEAGLSLAQRLSILTPFDKPLTVCHIPKCATIASCMKYSIVVTEEIININKNEKKKLPVSLFFCDRLEFEGTPCPDGSFVCRIAPMNETIKTLNDNIFLITAYNNIKHTFSKFLIKIAELTARTRQTRERMLSALCRPESFNFSPVDEPIFKYWMYCMASKQKSVRTILVEAD